MSHTPNITAAYVNKYETLMFTNTNTNFENMTFKLNITLQNRENSGLPFGMMQWGPRPPTNIEFVGSTTSRACVIQIL